MRQDPQVIMVGEIRDPETAAIAVQAGLTGHLVISTIHSGSTAGVFARLMNMDIEPFLLSSSMTGVLGLRLIRNNCTFCAQPYEPEPASSNWSRWKNGKRPIPPRRGMRPMPEHRLFRALFRRRIADGQPAVSRRGHAQIADAKPCSKWPWTSGMQTMWQRGLRRALHRPDHSGGNPARHFRG